jgi:hypothetical protein
METNPELSSPPRLIFDGKAWRPSRWRLASFLLVSLLGHLGVFYLFKVVTPLTTRRLPPEESVLILRGADPISAQILASLEDRSPAGMIISLTASDDANLPQLPLPAYTPSYQDYAPDYKFNWEPKIQVLPQLAEANRPLLPSRPRPQSNAQPVPAPLIPHLNLPPALAERGLAEPPTWPTDVISPEEPSEPHLFQLAVEASGLVKYCLSEGTSPPPALLETMRRLHFKPRLGASLLWAEVEVHW